MTKTTDFGFQKVPEDEKARRVGAGGEVVLTDINPAMPEIMPWL